MAPSLPPTSKVPDDLELALWAERLLALRCVKAWRDDPKKADSFYVVRRMIRWFSDNFSTPIAEVERLPLAYVARHYWEARYEAMAEEDQGAGLDEEAERITETRAEREGRALDEVKAVKEHDDFIEQTKRQAEERAARAKARGKLGGPKDPPEALRQAQEAARALAEAAKEALDGEEIRVNFGAPEPGASAEPPELPEFEDEPDPKATTGDAPRRR